MILYDFNSIFNKLTNNIMKNFYDFSYFLLSSNLSFASFSFHSKLMLLVELEKLEGKKLKKKQFQIFLNYALHHYSIL